MKKVIKKAVCVILSGAFLLSLCACNGNGKEESKFSYLSDYTIVYPAEYSEWKMQEVELLSKVIEHITGKEIKAVPDTETVDGKKIIMGSSSIKTAFSDTIDGFANAMCYVIGKDGDNIVLGGQNYYSDMRAVYDYLNNFLGYDDINDVCSEPSEELKDKKIVNWKKPDFYIMGSNFASYGPKEAYQYKDFVDCGFNLFQFTSSMLTDDMTFSLRDGVRMCARFGIEAMYLPGNLPGIVSSKYEITVPDEEDLIENPAMWGIYVGDEPTTDELYTKYSEAIKNGQERFGKYGWKFYVNAVSPGYPQSIEEDIYSNLSYWSKYYSTSCAFSFDFYFQHLTSRHICYCYIMEQCARLSREVGQDFYYYIESYDMKSQNLNSSKIFRTNSYLGLCFGAKMIEYFQYGDASILYPYEESYWTEGSLVNWDFTKNPAWYDAQRTNKELLKVTDILNDYEFVGTYTDDANADPVTDLLDPYDISGIFDVTLNPNNALVFGIYKQKNGDGYAILMLDFDEINDEPYDKTKNESFTFLSFNTKNVKCYIDGEPYELINTRDYIYEIPCGNGSCCLITIGE